MLWPSKFPSGVTSNVALKRRASSAPNSASTSSGAQTKNFPSSPSLSASWAE